MLMCKWNKVLFQLPRPWQFTFECNNKDHISTTGPSPRHLNWSVSLLTKGVMIAAIIAVNYFVSEVLFSCVCYFFVFGSQPSGQEKCWVTWPESQGLYLGVMGFLKVYRSECLNALLGACASLDVGFHADLCLLMDLCVCVFVYPCVCSKGLFDWQVWVLLQLAGSFQPFFCLAG